MQTVKEAVVARFLEILSERRIRPNELANRAGVTPSSVYSMLDPRRKEVSVNLVKKLCDGLDISLGEFFSAHLPRTTRQPPPGRGWSSNISLFSPFSLIA